MNVINVYEPVVSQLSELTTASRPAPRATIGATFTLRKSGARPISFSGRLLGHHDGHRAGAALWHELNLYKNEDGGFVADIRVLATPSGTRDQFHIAVVETLEEALQFFEGYDARFDVASDIPLDDDSLAPAELMVHAAALKVRVAEAVSMYRATLSTFLGELHKG